MKAFVISDVHIGSRYFLREKFLGFLRALPPDTGLILNGDIADYVHRPILEEHRDALDAIRAESLRRTVVWVWGNHDYGFRLEDPGQVQFVEHYSIGQDLFVSHGDHFDNIMPRHRTFLILFRSLHRLRVRFGAEAVHVAFFAKRFRLFYRVLRRQVIANAVEYAKENGYRAVTCGHTHFAEDTVVDGVRYVNTGSWTEQPVYALAIDGSRMELRRI
jgi:UDP-2,3-diacylglucosamine pyrophosphatase LpxH